MALELAQRFDAEIISADSMQLYRGLDIGSAKPSAAEQQLVRHHLIDTFDIGENVTVAAYCRLAEKVIKDIRKRGKRVIICGGSGLYIKTLLHGMDDLPADTELRNSLDNKYTLPEQIPDLRQAVTRIDPAAVNLPESLSLRRLIRILEITTLTGKLPPLNSQGERPMAIPAAVWVLRWEREILKERIRQRTAEMLASGWIEEAEFLLAKGLLSTPTARQAIGYDIIGEYLAKRISKDNLLTAIATKTWQYARRQQTWFAHQHPGAEFITMPADIAAIKKWPEPGKAY